ncbi:hypothetical protein ACJEIK_26400 [Mycobacterium sp. SMC-16]|uniref:hypothetical protein n=1 Tax=Mycobacterium sp. SMC-16 TaxID=3385967 RepID=UPI00390C73AD
MSAISLRRATVRQRTARRILLSVAAGAVLAGTGIAYADRADAQLDPRIPIPTLNWCLGGGAGSGFGSYCEGIAFPSGARLNYFRVLGYWQGPRCILPNGTPTPEPAAPAMCGGIG